MNPSPLLVTAPQAAALLGISERRFHTLRQRPDFAAAVGEIRLGARSVRFRVADIDRWAQSVAGSARPPEPAHLAAGRERRRAKLADTAAA